MEVPARRDQLIDPFLGTVDERAEVSNAKIRADVAHDKLGALRDDATVLSIDWHGPGAARDAIAGRRGRAT